MRVEALRTLGFRNLTADELRLGDGITLLWGPNGAGKTNLLEALYMALVGRSCRTRDDREAIAFGEGVARSEARIADRDERREFLFGVSRAEGRRHLVDGASADPTSLALRPPLAVFMPDRLALVKGGPAGRRAHLDRFCVALRPAGATARRRYARALAQRNALLGRVRTAATGPESLDAWDGELADAGAELIESRAAGAARLAAPFAEHAVALGLGERAALAYRPRCDTAEPAELRAELERRRPADVARGFTGWGPHLDELALELDGRSLRRYGSQGQQRVALLALLFAERTALLADRRPTPLMLLDDVTSELDGDRRQLLCDSLLGGGQALVTATAPDHLPAEAAREEVAVRDGRLIVVLAAEVAA